MAVRVAPRPTRRSPGWPLYDFSSLPAKHPPSAHSGQVQPIGPEAASGRVPSTADIRRERPLWHKAPQADRSVLRVPVLAISR